MADENETAETPEVSVTAPQPKKQRKPRQKKMTDAVTAASDTPIVKPPRKPRKKRDDRVTDVVSAIGDAPAISEAKPGRGRKGVARPRAPKPTAASAPVLDTALDEMVDLIQLEEENKRLRKALSEKLRAENADLRKKLGQA